MRLSEIVREVEGTLLSDGEFETMNYCTSEESRSFLTFMEKEKFIEKMNSNVSCVLCKPEMVELLPKFITGVFVTDEPKYYFHKIYHELGKQCERESFQTVIGSNCEISPMAYVPERNVIIGDNVIIEPFVMIGENVTIKDNCIIHANAVIGGRSFSVAKNSKGEMCGLDDLGKVVLEEDVEIFSGTHIAQGIWTTDITHIEEHTRIDTQGYIGHGVRIGKSVLIAAGVVIGGNTEIGNDVWIGLNATISNRLKIGQGSRISLGAVVTRDVAEHTTVTGNFAINHEKFIQHIKEIDKKS